MKRAIITAERQKQRPQQVPYIGDIVKQVSHIDGNVIADVCDAVFRTPIELERKRIREGVKTR